MSRIMYGCVWFMYGLVVRRTLDACVIGLMYGSWG